MEEDITALEVLRLKGNRLAVLTQEIAEFPKVTLAFSLLVFGFELLLPKACRVTERGEVLAVPAVEVVPAECVLVADKPACYLDGVSPGRVGHRYQTRAATTVDVVLLALLLLALRRLMDVESVSVNDKLSFFACKVFQR